jgi:hypothetical protein
MISAVAAKRSKVARQRRRPAKKGREKAPKLRTADECIRHAPVSDAVAFRRRTTVYRNGEPPNPIGLAHDLFQDAIEELRALGPDDDLAYVAAEVARAAGWLLAQRGQGKTPSELQQRGLRDALDVIRGNATADRKRLPTGPSVAKRLRLLELLRASLAATPDELTVWRLMATATTEVDRRFAAVSDAAVMRLLTKRRSKPHAVYAIAAELVIESARASEDHRGAFDVRIGLSEATARRSEAKAFREADDHRKRMTGT